MDGLKIDCTQKAVSKYVIDTLCLLLISLCLLSLPYQFNAPFNKRG
jgi:hypothetical protein